MWYIHGLLSHPDWMVVSCDGMSLEDYYSMVAWDAVVAHVDLKVYTSLEPAGIAYHSSKSW